MNDLIISWICAILVIIGSAFALLAAVGVIRLPDIYLRMHAATKAGTLGAGLVILAVGVRAMSWEVSILAFAAILFLLLTAPIGAHLLGRAAYVTRVPLWKNSITDELDGKYGGALDLPREAPLNAADFESDRHPARPES